MTSLLAKVSHHSFIEKGWIHLSLDKIDQYVAGVEQFNSTVMQFKLNAV